MTRTWIGALLIAATALTPIAASAQDGGFGSRIIRDAQRGGDARQSDAPAPQRAQYQRGEGRRGGDGGQRRGGGDGARQRGDGNGGGWQGRRGGGQTAAPAPTPAPVEGRRGGGDGARWQGRGDGQQRWQGDERTRGGERGQWQARRGGGVASEQIREAQRAAERRGEGRGGWQGRADDRTAGDFDRNGDGRVDRRWDRNGNGRTDRQWDRNRDGDLDRRWDRDDNGRLDRRWDGNRDGRLDRRYDRDRDGRYDRYDRYDNRYGHRRWDQRWRDDRRYDWRGHRARYGSHYRLGRYYSPYRNWNYRRLSIGFSLWPLFYSNQYWINDPWSYRLPDVYGPYRWVRYYDDALLVDVETGEVVDVIYDVFW